jgi:IclR family transcriptional regulator, acetate operon repressor
MASGNETSTVARVAAVLRALASDDALPEMAGSEVARIVGRERSQISRMLKALSETGLVEQNPETRAYRLGWQTYALTARAGDRRLVDKGAAVLRAVGAETGETVLLSVLQSDRSFTVLRERSRHTVQAGGWVGRTSPLHLSASGRVLLFDYDDEEVRHLVARGVAEDPGPGPALRTVTEVLERVRRERESGVAVAVDELEVGLTSVGAPVRDGRCRTVAALNISGPTSRMSGRIEQLSATAAAAARKLGQLLTVA